MKRCPLGDSLSAADSWNRGDSEVETVTGGKAGMVAEREKADVLGAKAAEAAAEAGEAAL